jgi:hypothetical protein
VLVAAGGGAAPGDTGDGGAPPEEGFGADDWLVDGGRARGAAAALGCGGRALARGAPAMVVICVGPGGQARVEDVTAQVRPEGDADGCQDVVPASTRAALMERRR